MCGGVWAFAGPQVKNALYTHENVLAFKWHQLEGQRGPWRFGPWSLWGFGEVPGEVFEQDWPEQRYPDLKGLPRYEQRHILYDKMVCDAVIGVQIGLLWALPFYFVVLFVLPAAEALVAGSLWRRHQRLGPVAAAYAERIIPLMLSLLAAVYVVVLIVAQVAAWRGWWWPLRLLLIAAGIALFVWARTRLP